MNEIEFLAEWALRSSILIFGGALLIWLTRIKDPAIRLAGWIALLLGSLLIPVMTMTLPVLPVRVLRTAAPVQGVRIDFRASTPVVPLTAVAEPQQFNWYRAGLMLYAIVAAGMLLRLCIGLALSWRILRRSRRTDHDFFVSCDIGSPATLGIFRPAIVLPEDWTQWDAGKLDSVLAHERSHVERDDPAVQLLSAIHRALLWFSPAAWFLHSKIVCAGEELSDDAAIAVTADRPAYAGILVEFMQRRALPHHDVGVPMSRYGSADRRIQRILDSSTLSRGMTWLGVMTMLVIASPFAYFMATAVPATAAQAPPPASTSTSTKPHAASPQTRPGPGRNGGSRMSGIVGLGTVTARVVPIRAWIQGSLKSVNFQEGEPVHAGDVVAVLTGVHASDQQLTDQQAVVDLLRDTLTRANGPDARRDAEAKYELAQHQLELSKAGLADFKIKAPVSGIAGFRLVEPGNMVRPTDANAILTIAEVQPISVLFTLPERFVPQVRELLDSGNHPTVEAWNNDNSARIATGVLTAMDNQIDPNTGTIKLKATFENKDRKLYPDQFVNVRLHMK